MGNAGNSVAKGVFQAVRTTPVAIYVAIIAVGLAFCLGDLHVVGVPIMMIAAVGAAIALALPDLSGKDASSETFDG